MARSGKECPALKKDRKALVAGCLRGAVGSPTVASVSGIAACSVSRLLCTPTPGCLQALSSCLSLLPDILGAPLIPLRACMLSEITEGIDSLASVLLLARFYVPFPMTVKFSLSKFHHLARSVPIAHTHKPTGRCFYAHMCTHMHGYTLTSLRCLYACIYADVQVCSPGT